MGETSGLKHIFEYFIFSNSSPQIVVTNIDQIYYVLNTRASLLLKDEENYKFDVDLISSVKGTENYRIDFDLHNANEVFFRYG